MKGCGKKTTNCKKGGMIYNRGFLARERTKGRTLGSICPNRQESVRQKRATKVYKKKGGGKPKRKIGEQAKKKGIG